MNNNPTLGSELESPIVSGMTLNKLLHPVLILFCLMGIIIAAPPTCCGD